MRKSIKKEISYLEHLEELEQEKALTKLIGKAMEGDTYAFIVIACLTEELDVESAQKVIDS